MTINNTKHIVMDEDDIKSAIVDYLFRTNLIEAECSQVKLAYQQGGQCVRFKADIEIPIESDQLINLQEDLGNG